MNQSVIAGIVLLVVAVGYVAYKFFVQNNE